MTDLWQSAAFMKMSSLIAIVSVTAPRSGLLGSIPLNFNESKLIFAPSKGCI